MRDGLTAILMVLAGALVAGAFLAGNGAKAAEHSRRSKWINQCIADNKSERGATPESSANIACA